MVVGVSGNEVRDGRRVMERRGMASALTSEVSCTDWVPSSTPMTSSWQKGVPHPIHDSINIWSLNAFGEPVFTGGLYTPSEIDTLVSAVHDYCASRSVTPQELCGENHNKAVRGAWHQIAQCLPHRTVVSVYRRALRQFSGHTTGQWTEEERSSLFRLVELHGNQWKTIQDALGRSAHHCRSKFLESQDEFEKGRWSVQQMERLLSSVRDVLQVPTEDMDVRQINQWTLETKSKIPWTVVSLRVRRSRVDCYYKWKVMTRQSNKFALELGWEPIPMVRQTLKFDVQMEYYRWKAEQDPKWRQRYTESCIRPLLDNGLDQTELQMQQDDSLLSAVVQSKAMRPSEMAWNTVRMRNDPSPRERFDRLVEEYAPSDAMDLPLWELAMMVRSALHQKKDYTKNHPTSSSFQKRTSLLDIPDIRHHIQEILETVDSNAVTVKGVRKRLETQLGCKLGKFKEEFKDLIREML